jgi:hypothetical protein
VDESNRGDVRSHVMKEYWRERRRVERPGLSSHARRGLAPREFPTPDHISPTLQSEHVEDHATSKVSKIPYLLSKLPHDSKRK